MKNNTKYIAIVMVLFAIACRKEYKEIGDIPNRVDGITARWVMNSCSVIDKGGFVEETMVITPFFSTTPKLPNITFAMENSIGRYTSDTSNVAFQFFGGTSGTWRFDNNDFPKLIFLTPDNNTPPITLSLAGPIRPTDTYLRIDKSISCGNAEKAVYRLSFIRN